MFIKEKRKMKVKYSGIEMRDQRTRGGRGRYPILC